MLKQNVLQVYRNQKGEITIAKGLFEKLSEPVVMDSVSVSSQEAKQIIKALKNLIDEIESEMF